MRGHLMVIVEEDDDDIERLNTHPNLLPSQECIDNVSAEDASVLVKVVDIVKDLEVAHNALPNATKKTQSSVAALLSPKTLARRT